MKNKGIWFVIAGIIAAGIIITILNTVFLNKQAEQENAVIAAQEQMVEKGEAHLNEAGRTETGAGEPEAIEDSYAEAVPEQAEAGNSMGKSPVESPSAAQEQTVVISPLETAPATEAEPSELAKQSVGRSSALMLEEDGKINYRARLDELDLQIQRIRVEETESTTYSLKTAAENELKLWDSELNNIYNDILNYLNEEEKKELVLQERAWMKSRDAKAVDAAKKSSGGSLEGLEYTASLAKSTKTRAYELAEMYDQVTD